MLIKNATKTEIESALAEVNKQFEDNIIFNRFDSANRKQTRWNVTLKVQDSKKAGHRRGFPRFTGFNTPPDWNKRRRMPYACWHVHGTFFDKLFEIAPLAAVRSGSSLANPNRSENGWITIDGGNWQDRDIGSVMNPYWFSDACDCEESEELKC